jgi:hypothetical protein
MIHRLFSASQEYSLRILRLSGNSFLRDGIRLSMYAMLGVLLLTIGVTSSLWSSQRAQFVAKQAKEQLEKRKITDQANATVTALVRDAEKALDAKDLQAAWEKLEAARKTLHATEFGQVNAVAIRLANAKVTALYLQAITALRTGDIEASKLKLKVALAVPSATNTGESRALDALIAKCTDPVHVRSQLLELSDKEFQEFTVNEIVPPQLMTPFDALSKHVKRIATAEIANATKDRESMRLAQLDAERQAKEKADAAAAAVALRAEAKRIQDGMAAMATARKAALEKEEQRLALQEVARKAEEEIDANGLVLLRKTVEGKGGELDGEITGIVVNRRGKKLRYAQITFNLYDDSGAQVGTALANINGLEPGGRWKFSATSFGTNFTKYKFSELSGF